MTVSQNSVGIQAPQPDREPVSTRTRCAFCESAALEQVMDLGNVALAGGFLSAEQFENELKFPLRLFFCRDCFAVQLVDVVDASILFKNYFYFSSAIASLREHFADYAAEVVSRFLDPPRATAVEIGCNDGILLRPLADQQVRTVVGVDPATNVVSKINDPRINVINDFFSEDTAKTIEDRFGKADLIAANNVYAHIPDICGVTSGVKNLLADDGVFVFEVHYLGKVIQGLQYDMIYHEHLYYHSLLSLMGHFERYGLCIFDVKPIDIHAGSMRYYVAKKTSKHARQVSPRVDLLRSQELAAGFNSVRVFVRFAAEVAERRTHLMNLLVRLREKKRRVVGYGASGRANTIIQYCGITSDHLEYMTDDAPAKAGFYTPGSHLLIRSADQAFSDDRPDYLLILAWGYFNEIARRRQQFLDSGGRMIVPLPDVRVTFRPSADDDGWL